MNTRTTVAIAGVLATGLVIGRYVVPHSPPSAQPAAPAAGEPTARVQATALQERDMSETIVAFGAVVAAAGELRTLSVPYEARVERIEVSAGQQVEQGTLIAVVLPSEDTKLALKAAQTDLGAAQAALTATREKLALGLATRPDEQQANERLRHARETVQSLRARGAGRAQELRATKPGVVSRVLAEPGQTITAGTTVAELADDEHLSISVGVEPEHVGSVRVGQSVRLTPVGQSHSETLSGAVKTKTRTVNPATRLVDIMLTTPSSSRLMLNEYVRAEVVTEAKRVLAAPRSAIVQSDSGPQVFTVENDHAKAHSVTIGLEEEGYVEVLAENLKAGQSIVTAGQTALRDGMPVVIVSEEAKP